jgi:hypothetical protein
LAGAAPGGFPVADVGFLRVERFPLINAFAIPQIKQKSE